jgi:hypothetical protein
MRPGPLFVLNGKDLRPLSEDRISDWALSPIVAAGAEPASIIKSLEESPDLYLDFCSLPPTQESIKKFADEFGLLGLPEGDGRNCCVYPRSGKQLQSELQQDWQNQIAALNAAADLYRMIRDALGGNPAELELHIGWDEDLTCVRWLQGAPIETGSGPFRGGSIIAHHLDRESRIWKILRQNPSVAPATYRLMELLGTRGGVAARLDIATSVFQLDPDSLGLFFFPENLISCLWLQFGQAVASRRRIRRCLACERWISISAAGDGKRAERRSCNGKCRNRLFEWRRDALEQLGRRKLTSSIAEKIAHNLGINQNTVKELIATAAKKTGSVEK